MVLLPLLLQAFSLFTKFLIPGPHPLIVLHEDIVPALSPLNHFPTTALSFTPFLHAYIKHHRLVLGGDMLSNYCLNYNP